MVPHRAPQGGDAATLPERGAERVLSRGGLNPPRRGAEEKSDRRCRRTELRRRSRRGSFPCGVAALSVAAGLRPAAEETQREYGRECTALGYAGWRAEVRGVTEDRGIGNCGVVRELAPRLPPPRKR